MLLLLRIAVPARKHLPTELGARIVLLAAMPLVRQHPLSGKGGPILLLLLLLVLVLVLVQLPKRIVQSPHAVNEQAESLCAPVALGHLVVPGPRQLRVRGHEVLRLARGREHRGFRRVREDVEAGLEVDHVLEEVGREGVLRRDGAVLTKQVRHERLVLRSEALHVHLDLLLIVRQHGNLPAHKFNVATAGGRVGAGRGSLRLLCRRGASHLQWRGVVLPWLGRTGAGLR